EPATAPAPPRRGGGGGRAHRLLLGARLVAGHHGLRRAAPERHPGVAHARRGARVPGEVQLVAVHGVPEGRRIWQEVAEAFRPPNDPFALYAQDERIGTLHAATLAINFEMGVNTLSLHNAWNVGHWFGPYPLRIPDEERVTTFPRMVTPEEAAEAMGYE